MQCTELQARAQHHVFPGGKIAPKARRVGLSKAVRDDRLGHHASYRLVCRPSEGGLSLGIPPRDHARFIHRDHRIQRRIDNRTCVVLVVAQGLLGALAVRDVRRDAEHAVDTATCVSQGTFDRHVGVRAVFEVSHFLFGQRSARGNHSHVHGAECVSLFTWKQIVVGLAGDGVVADVEQFRVAPVDHQVTALEVLHVDNGFRVVGNRVQQFLAFVYSQLCSAPFVIGATNTGSGRPDEQREDDDIGHREQGDAEIRFVQAGLLALETQPADCRRKSRWRPAATCASTARTYHRRRSALSVPVVDARTAHQSPEAPNRIMPCSGTGGVKGGR